MPVLASVYSHSTYLLWVLTVFPPSGGYGIIPPNNSSISKLNRCHNCVKLTVLSLNATGMQIIYSEAIKTKYNKYSRLYSKAALVLIRDSKLNESCNWLLDKLSYFRNPKSLLPFKPKSMTHVNWNQTIVSVQLHDYFILSLYKMSR